MVCTWCPTILLYNIICSLSQKYWPTRKGKILCCDTWTSWIEKQLEEQIQRNKWDYSLEIFCLLKLAKVSCFMGLKWEIGWNFIQCVYVTQYNKRHILSTSEQIEIFAICNRGFNKLSNDTQFLKIEVILLEIQILQSLYFPLFYWFICTLFCSLSQNEPGLHDVPFVVLGHILRSG